MCDISKYVRLHFSLFTDMWNSVLILSLISWRQTFSTYVRTGVTICQQLMCDVIISTLSGHFSGYKNQLYPNKILILAVILILTLILFQFKVQQFEVVLWRYDMNCCTYMNPMLKHCILQYNIFIGDRSLKCWSLSFNPKYVQCFNCSSISRTPTFPTHVATTVYFIF